MSTHWGNHIKHNIAGNKYESDFFHYTVFVCFVTLFLMSCCLKLNWILYQISKISILLLDEKEQNNSLHPKEKKICTLIVLTWTTVVDPAFCERWRLLSSGILIMQMDHTVFGLYITKPCIYFQLLWPKVVTKIKHLWEKNYMWAFFEYIRTEYFFK